MERKGPRVPGVLKRHSTQLGGGGSRATEKRRSRKEKTFDWAAREDLSQKKNYERGEKDIVFKKADHRGSYKKERLGWNQ